MLNVNFDWITASRSGEEPLFEVVEEARFPRSRWAGRTRDGAVLAELLSGDWLLEATGSLAREWKPRLAQLGMWRCARVDACLDTDLLGFDDLEALAVESSHGSAQITKMESVRGGQGRTLYVGASSSRIRCRLYEKGLQDPDNYASNVVRFEVQLRPDSQFKKSAMLLSEVEVLSASSVGCAVLECLGVKADHVSVRETKERVYADDWLPVWVAERIEKRLLRNGGDVYALIDDIGKLVDRKLV